MKKTSLYLEPELDAALAKRAADDGLSKAELIRRELRRSLGESKRPRLSVGVVAGRPSEYADLETELTETGFGELAPARRAAP